MAPIIFVSLCVLAGAASAAPIHSFPLAYVSLSPIPENVYNQVQDTKSGEYAFGYAGGPVAREEARTADGVTRGAYSYVDAHGIVQHYRYVADDEGFRVAGTNIPTEEASSHQLISSRRKRSVSETRIPVAVETVYALPATQLAFAGVSLPTSTSSQSRVQIHKSLKTKIRTPLEAIAVETSAAVPATTVAVSAVPVAAKIVDAVPVAIAPALPVSTSSHSRYQIHKTLKTDTSPALAVEAAPPALAAPIAIETESVVETVPATSSQSRFQIRDSSKTEIHEAPRTIPVAVRSEAAADLAAEAPAVVKTIDTSPVVASVATATSSQRHFRAHNSAKVEFDAHLQPLIALHPENSVSLPLVARHPIGVGLGVVPAPLAAYNTYGATLIAEA